MFKRNVNAENWDGPGLTCEREKYKLGKTEEKQFILNLIFMKVYKPTQIRVLELLW